MGFFGGQILVQGFFGVLIFAPIQSSLSLEIWSTPWGDTHSHFDLRQEQVITKAHVQDPSTSLY